MLTKHVSTVIDPQKDTQVRCPVCRNLVAKIDMVNISHGDGAVPKEICVTCYSKL